MNIEVALSANLFFGCKGSVAQCTSWSASGDADFGETASVTGIELVDSTGNPIQNFSITSTSGTFYGPNGVIPEPATAAELLGGVLAILAFARLRDKFQGPRAGRLGRSENNETT